MPENMQAQSDVARLVPDTERLDFLPFYFSRRLMLQDEHQVYSWMQALCENYRGGFWNYYEVSNGGFYMAPASPRRFKVAVEGNGFEGELSADAAGIVATLFTLSHLSMSEASGSSRDAMADSFHALRTSFRRTLKLHRSFGPSTEETGRCARRRKGPSTAMATMRARWAA